MCIRDRYSSPTLRDAYKALETESVRCMTCLLYTSTQVVQQANGVNIRVDSGDQLHDGLGVQCVGGAGDVLLAVKACSSGVGMWKI